MQVFELYFNPKKRDDILLTSFVCTPANIYEKRLGNLYVVGELTQAMPQNAHFLANLSSVIKKEYYASGLKKSCEASLKEALKKSNEFLEQESGKGNVGWLGNLHFAILSFKDPVLNFAKTGDVKIFLVRAGALTEISQNLEMELLRSDPLKVFGGIAEGKLLNEDKIIILNKRILNALGKKQKFLGELAKVSDEKELRQILKARQTLLAGISGICLVLMMAGEDGAKHTVTLQKELPNFSFPRLKVPKINIPKITLLKLPGWPKLPNLPNLPKINFRAARKKIFLVISLILILLVFYYIFQGERAQELKNAQTKLNEAQAKAMLAESLLILKEDARAKALFEEILDVLSPLTKRGSPLRDDALFLQNSVKQRLK